MCPWALIQEQHPEAESHSGPAPAGLLGFLASPRPDRRALRAAVAALPPQSVPRLLEALRFHRIDGLAHRALSVLPPDSIDPWLRSTLKRRSQKLAAATLAQGLALAEVLDALHQARIPVMVMRGLRSAESIYADPSVRPFEDHDLLVLPGDRPQAATVLERQGLEPIAPALFRRGGLLIDLHIDPFGAARRPTRSLLLRMSPEELFERSTPGSVAGAPSLLLDPADELLLMAIHVVKHSFDRLIRIADVAHLLSRPEGAAHREAALRRAGSSGGRRILGWAIAAATPLGVPLSPALRTDPPASALESIIMRRVVRFRPFPYAGEVLMTLALPGLAARLRFLCDALFPSGPTPRPAWRKGAVLSGRTIAIVRQAAAQAQARKGAR